MPVSTGSQITRVELDADRTIENGQTIRVNNITISNASNSDVEVVFKDNDGTALANVSVQAHDTEDGPCGWIADNGLVVEGLSNSDVVVTIVHSAGGV